ncbi:MAG: hypothetical protein WDM80_12355 [Limisphaerales bacterium]
MNSFGKISRAGWLRPWVILLLLAAQKTALTLRGNFDSRKKSAEPAAS